MRGTETAMVEGQCLLAIDQNVQFQKPRQQHQCSCTLSFYTLSPMHSWAIMTSLNNVKIVCSPIWVGKALHMCRRATLIHLHTCWHPCWLFSTTMHEPCHHIHNPNSKPVTLIWYCIVYGYCISKVYENLGMLHRVHVLYLCIGQCNLSTKC